MPSRKTKTETTTGKLLKPELLKPGDAVGLVCPASRPASPAVLARCVRVVTEMGFKPLVGESAFKTCGYMAGTDEERLRDLERFLSDESVRGVFCVSGGFGSLRLLPRLNYRRIAASPKVIVGCDDNTHLLLALHRRCGMVTFHGPNLDQVTTRYSFDRLKEVLTRKSNIKMLSVSEATSEGVADGFPYTPVSGIASGALLGGNLTALVSLMGTPYAPDLSDAVLFLEDKNERTDILDRWFTTLYISGQLAATRAVAFGEFLNCGARGSNDLLSIEELFGDRLKQLSKPSCFGLSLGQSSRTATVPLGVMVNFDSGKGTLEFLEGHFN
jgi:muramoyltetrapeptide carboxypeptidase